MRVVFRLIPRTLLATLSACLAAALLVVASAPTGAQAGQVKMEWFGWSHFRFTSVEGKIIHVNPFVRNPDSSITLDEITQLDLIVAADGHGDELGQSIDILKKVPSARLFVPFELGAWVIGQGVPAAQVIRSNPGGRVRVGDVWVRMVASVHGSGLTGLPQAAPDQPLGYGGPAAGFVMTFENGFTVYFAGSTAATQDQALWGAMYKPHVAILPLNSDREPLDTAMMVRLLQTDNPNLKLVVPHHHRVVQQPRETTVADLEAAIASMGLGVPVLNVERSTPYLWP